MLIMFFYKLFGILAEFFKINDILIGNAGNVIKKDYHIIKS